MTRHPLSFLSNGLTGPCGVNINAPLVSVTQNGGTYTNKWEYTHPCTGQVFTHIQRRLPSLHPICLYRIPIFEICQGNVFDLSSIEVIDLNDTDPVITYHSTIPADPSMKSCRKSCPIRGCIFHPWPECRRM